MLLFYKNLFFEQIFFACSPERQLPSTSTGQDHLVAATCRFYACLFALAFSLIPSLTMAAGFRIGEQGAAAMGRANAVAASINDASAVYFNPAALTTSDGNEISLGATMIVPSTDYASINGFTTSKEKQYFYLPNFFIGRFWKEKKLALGFGLYAPFGLGSKWNTDSPFRYEATYTNLSVINFNPTIAFRYNSYISFGAGMNYERLSVTYNKRNPWKFFGGRVDGKTELTGNGTGLGYNFGFQFAPTGKMKIGIAYRSRIHFKITGKIEISDINGSSPLASFGNSFYRTDVSLPFDLPDILFIGISYKFFDRLIIEFDLDWTGWSSYKDLKFNYIDEKPPLLKDTTVKKDWKDVLAFRTGFEYFINKKIKLRGGYAFDPTPVPESTFEARITDSNRYQLTIGGGFALGKFAVDIAYMALFFENRIISDNEVGSPLTDIKGTYKSFGHLAGVNVSYRF